MAQWEHGFKVGEKAIKRRHNARIAAVEILLPIKDQEIPVESIIQVGLGDWAEGPVLLEFFPNVPMLAGDPVIKYAFDAWAAGFRGPIIPGLFSERSGDVVELIEWHTRTSIWNHEKRHQSGPAFKTMTITLDDAVQATLFPIGKTLLWMDCEGAELIVLRGAMQTLKHVTCIVCELKEEPALAGWPNAFQVKDTLDQLGFDLVKEARSDGLFIRKGL